jgi:hypothetical protein
MNPITTPTPVSVTNTSDNIYKSSSYMTEKTVSITKNNRLMLFALCGAGTTQSVQRRDGRTGFDSRQRQEIFLFSRASRTALGSTQPPIQWVPGALSPRVLRPRREADTHLHLILRSRIVELCLHSPSSWCGA